jgi:hypothetical protein
MYCYFYVYIFLLLCMFCSVDSVFIVLFYVLFVLKICKTCTVLLPPCVNPITVNKYIIIISSNKLQYTQIKFMLMTKRNVISIVLYVISVIQNYH